MADEAGVDPPEDNSSGALTLWLALCPPRAWYEPKAFPQTVHLYSSCLLGATAAAAAAVVVDGRELRCWCPAPSCWPRASMTRQRARYSSSVGGRGRFDRLRLGIISSLLLDSGPTAGGGMVEIVVASTAISISN